MNDDTDCCNEKLDEVIAECIGAEEAGEAVDRETLLAAHPDLADELREFFADRDKLRHLAGGMKGWSRQRQFVPPKVRYIGDYELLEEIARGGMGVVYKARQTSLGRIVAVKMILAGQLAEADDVKRFQSEAEAAASLSHPGIVAVHEVGLHHGWHYFSMDFIEGPNLAERIRDQPLPARRAAGYVQSIAAAVHYAHGQGVLHRDLKPSNILLDASDQVHVTDFGLARRIEVDSKLTHTGQILGTPSYLAPEQAEGKRALIGPASDIYSLGVILYELLTGRPPFQSDSPVETIRQVLDTEPVSPRLLNPAVPRDLETICLKCLQKEPHKRYGTAELLADDLGRFLAGEPIAARPVGSAERAWRWCRRNPALAAASGLALTTLLAGLVLVAGLWQRAERHLALATSESMRANEAAERAREAADYARHALDTMTSQVATQWLSAQDQMSSEQKEFLLTAVTHYRKFSAASADGKSHQDSVAAAAFQLGKLLQKLGETNQAEAAFRQALEIRLAMPDQASTRSADILELARNYQALDVILRTSGRYVEAEQANYEAITLLAQSRRDNPEDQPVQHELADAYTNQGNLLRTMNRLDEAADAQLSALEIRRTLVASTPDRPEFQQKLSLVLNNLALIKVNQQQWAAAEELLVEALAIKQQLVANFPDERKFAEDLGLGLTNHGAFLHKLQRLPEAEQYAGRGIDCYARLANDYPSRPQYRYMHGAGLLTQGIILLGMDEQDRAETRFEQANKILAEVNRQHPDVWTYLHQSAATLVKLGDLSRDRDQLTTAAQFYSQAIDPLEAFHQRRADLGPIRQMLHNATIGRATVRAWLGQFDDSLVDWDRAIELSQPDRQDAWRLARGTTLVRAGRLSEAINEAEVFTRDSQDVNVLFNGACVFAVAAGVSTSDEATAQLHREKSCELLRRAISLGFLDLAALQNDRDLESLRPHPIFQAIISQLEQNVKR